MKEGDPISEAQRGVAQPKINRQEQTSSVVDAKGDLVRRDEMANAKEFDYRNAESAQARKCTTMPYPPGPCLHPKCSVPEPCLVPPKCGLLPKPEPRPRPPVQPPRRPPRPNFG